MEWAARERLDRRRSIAASAIQRCFRNYMAPIFMARQKILVRSQFITAWCFQRRSDNFAAVVDRVGWCGSWRINVQCVNAARGGVVGCTDVSRAVLLYVFLCRTTASLQLGTGI